jgi:ATP-dependent Clp protease ATP-binding subunit ClpC
MYERFTDRARQCMQLATKHAHRCGHEYVGTEHMLLGIVDEGSGVGANVLKNLGVDLRKVRQEVDRIIGNGADSDDQSDQGRLPQTPRAKKAIEYAIDEARQLGHNYVGTEHLLLGLLREDDSVAAQVLIHLGVNLESVRKEVKDLLGQTPLMSPGSRTKKIEPGDAVVEKTFKLDDSGDAKRFEMFSPAQVDQFVRQAIQVCWMSLPKERRTLDELEAQIRHLVDRAMRDFRAQQFDANGPSTHL